MRLTAKSFGYWLIHPHIYTPPTYNMWWVIARMRCNSHIRHCLMVNNNYASFSRLKRERTSSPRITRRRQRLGISSDSEKSCMRDSKHMMLRCAQCQALFEYFSFCLHFRVFVLNVVVCALTHTLAPNVLAAVGAALWMVMLLQVRASKHTLNVLCTVLVCTYICMYVCMHVLMGECVPSET